MSLGMLSSGATCTQNSLLGILNMPCASDSSVTILQEIFGDQVATLVHGPTTNITPLIPHFLSNFNAVLVSGALVLYALIIIVGTVNTGHQGKFLGQQWDSIWTVVRVIGGTVAMVPLKFGLCAAQVLVLMLVLFGVHAASTVWAASLKDVDYGTPPSVPASAINIVRNAIANEIVMETYNQITGLNGNPNPPSVSFGTNIYADFYGSEATGLRATIKALFPDFCKSALRLGTVVNKTTDMNLTPDNRITGSDLGQLKACEQLGNDFLQSGASPHFSTSEYAGIFNTGGTQPAHVWIGQNLATYAGCSTSPLYIDKTCYAHFPGEAPVSNNHIYHIVVTNPNTKQPITFLAQATGGAFYGAGTWPTFNSPSISTEAKYIPPVAQPNATQKALSKDITNFVANNITAHKCLGPKPDPSCSMDISNIISAFNKDLAKDETGTTHKIAPGEDTPTSSSQTIPGTGTPLNSSWWNAGEIYLIIDKQMAANLSSLYQQLSELTGNDPLGHYTAQTTAAVRLSMSLYDSGEKSRDTASGVFRSQTQTTSTPALWTAFINSTPAIKDNPTAYAKLSHIPAGDTLGFLLIGHSGQFYFDAYTYTDMMVRLYDIMAANGLLDSAETDSSLTPITSAMNKIFTGLMGSDGNGAAANVTNLMNEVYQLGLDNPSNDMISNNLSVIQRAQRTGMDMIVTTVNSITSVYNHYANEYHDLQNNVEDTAIGAGAASSALAVAAISAGFWGSAGAAAGLGAAAEVSAQAGQTTIQIMTLLKMSSLAQSLMWMPIVIVVLTSLFTAGVSFALMLPLIPFILFWAGQIAWILGTLEAIIAAPFLMLALVLPGGHHFAGHTVPGLRMLLGVIFRPVLMVLGLLIGMVLTYIVIAFSADAFHVVAVTLIGGVVNGVPQSGIIPNTPYYQNANGIIACLLLFLYCSFLMLAFQKCFSPIYLLPEKVVQMMGGQADKAGEQDLQGLQQGVNQQSQSLAQSGGQTANKGIEAQQQKSQAVKGSSEAGMGAASRVGGMGKQYTYDKNAWKNHQQAKEQKQGSAGLSSAESGGRNAGGAGSGSGGHDTRNPQNNPALQNPNSRQQ